MKLFICILRWVLSTVVKTVVYTCDRFFTSTQAYLKRVKEIRFAPVLSLGLLAATLFTGFFSQASNHMILSLDILFFFSILLLVFFNLLQSSIAFAKKSF